MDYSQENKPRILILDDEERVRKIIAMQLEREGYDVVMSKDGRDVVDRLARGEVYDLLVSDIRMPGIDGFHILSYASENVSDMPV